MAGTILPAALGYPRVGMLFFVPFLVVGGGVLLLRVLGVRLRRR